MEDTKIRNAREIYRQFKQDGYVVAGHKIISTEDKLKDFFSKYLSEEDVTKVIYMETIIDVIIINKNNSKDMLKFFEQLSFSTSYSLRATTYLFGIQYKDDYIDYQEYSKLNNQHLYTVVDFLEEAREDVTIELGFENRNNIKFIFEEVKNND